MDGFTFYACMPAGRESKSASKKYPHQPWTRATLKAMAERGAYADCMAVATDPSQAWLADRGGLMKECIGGVYLHDNSACCAASTSVDYLRNRCVRISEALARRLHPELFKRLAE